MAREKREIRFFPGVSFANSQYTYAKMIRFYEVGLLKWRDSKKKPLVREFGPIIERILRIARTAYEQGDDGTVAIVRLVFEKRLGPTNQAEKLKEMFSNFIAGKEDGRSAKSEAIEMLLTCLPAQTPPGTIDKYFGPSLEGGLLDDLLRDESSFQDLDERSFSYRDAFPVFKSMMISKLVGFLDRMFEQGTPEVVKAVGMFFANEYGWDLEKVRRLKVLPLAEMRGGDTPSWFVAVTRMADRKGGGVRVEIRHVSHAIRYAKVAKQILLEHLTGPQGARLPTQAIRDAVCQGFGYGSFAELKRLLERHERILPPIPSDEQLAQALARGFSFALPVAERYAFSYKQIDHDRFVAQLASEAVEKLRSRPHAEGE